MRLLTPDETDAALPWCARARATWACRPARAEPLVVRVEFVLGPARPRVQGITLEGALQAAVVTHATGVAPSDAFVGFDAETQADLPLPLRDVEMHGRPIACAAWPRWAPGTVEAVTSYVHKPEWEGIGSRKVGVASGEGKPKRQHVPYLAASWADFDVVGDRERLVALVAWMNGLGGRRSAGHGAILRAAVAPSDADRSLLRDGSPARALPVADEAEAVARFPRGYVLAECGTRAPYWHRGSKTLCACPLETGC